ncbi:MAG: hypothetical protein AVDCRST_MAG93-942 [uncultured Chloroflexia bacterium]|uniref:Uncharacterized protein n=1 Tax=uncultured Chloroflexia bacterium TaxID=1672391 RepID=A0A6J4HTT7_9CHLR|nr:MAG: hypothetical protein AVDCRST_MAG93-942 [uncultured Chloroflexia bacterium]
MWKTARASCCQPPISSNSKIERKLKAWWRESAGVLQRTPLPPAGSARQCPGLTWPELSRAATTLSAKLADPLVPGFLPHTHRAFVFGPEALVLRRLADKPGLASSRAGSLS